MKKMWVYAIQSTIRPYIYVGMTNNLDRRLHQHNSGRQRSTKAFAPFTLIYKVECADRKSARTLEKKLKSGYGKEFLKKL